MIAAYPLTWPQGFPRAQRRLGGAFKASLAGALENVQSSLRLFGKDSDTKIDSVVISSNVTLGQQRPADPGVAVWFSWDGRQVCIPVDRYDKVEGNLQAIHHIIEARRTELRHGGLAIVRATFTGFAALPAPNDSRQWRDVLGVGALATVQIVKDVYRRRRSESHPDKRAAPSNSSATCRPPTSRPRASSASRHDA